MQEICVPNFVFIKDNCPWHPCSFGEGIFYVDYLGLIICLNPLLKIIAITNVKIADMRFASETPIVPIANTTTVIRLKIKDKTIKTTAIMPCNNKHFFIF